MSSALKFLIGGWSDGGGGRAATGDDAEKVKQRLGEAVMGGYTEQSSTLRRELHKAHEDLRDLATYSRFSTQIRCLSSVWQDTELYRVSLYLQNIISARCLQHHCPGAQ